MFRNVQQTNPPLFNTLAVSRAFAKRFGKTVRLSTSACAALAIFQLASSCAPHSEFVQAQYISPLTYQSYSCDQLAAERQRIKGKLSEVSRVQDDRADRDTVAAAVGVVFPFALLFLIGEDRSAELSRLKGEQEAIESVAIQNDCTKLQKQIELDRTRSRDSTLTP